MVEIQHLDLMRAILFHRLNIIYAVDSLEQSHWTLGNEQVCVERTKHYSYIPFSTMVTESFKRQYIDTLPEDAVRCRSCSKRVGCDIIRINLDEHCNAWSK